MDSNLRPHIYNIYGLVRIADEIVDTYTGQDASAHLSNFERETYAALECGFSTNPIIHAFQLTARTYDIPKKLITPFFDSMRSDLNPPKNVSDSYYKTYIYGSAEVVGLMCLAVYCKGDRKLISSLTPGAQALGAAFQKINFLRDIKDDTLRLGRNYFPNTGPQLTDSDKKAIIEDIESDFQEAYLAIIKLPQSSRTAVFVAYKYYEALLKKLKRAPVKSLYAKRVRINNAQKLCITIAAVVSIPFQRSVKHV